jgi:hypothetical protein
MSDLFQAKACASQTLWADKAKPTHKSGTKLTSNDGPKCGMRLLKEICGGEFNGGGYIGEITEAAIDHLSQLYVYYT